MVPTAGSNLVRRISRTSAKGTSTEVVGGGGASCMETFGVNTPARRSRSRVRPPAIKIIRKILLVIMRKG
jgi:hypothetical protein